MHIQKFVYVGNSQARHARTVCQGSLDREDYFIKADKFYAGEATALDLTASVVPIQLRRASETILFVCNRVKSPLFYIPGVFLSLLFVQSIESNSLRGHLPDMPGTDEFYCLSILGYRRPGLSQEEYMDYMINRHAPLVVDLLTKHRILQYNVVRPILLSFRGRGRHQPRPLEK